MDLLTEVIIFTSNICLGGWLAVCLYGESDRMQWTVRTTHIRVNALFKLMQNTPTNSWAFEYWPFGSFSYIILNCISIRPPTTISSATLLLSLPAGYWEGERGEKSERTTRGRMEGAQRKVEYFEWKFDSTNKTFVQITISEELKSINIVSVLSD